MTLQFMIMHYHTIWCIIKLNLVAKRITSGDKRYYFDYINPHCDLALEENKPIFSITLQLMLLSHHTKFRHKRFSNSENIVWTTSWLTEKWSGGMGVVFFKPLLSKFNVKYALITEDSYTTSFLGFVVVLKPCSSENPSQKVFFKTTFCWCLWRSFARSSTVGTRKSAAQRCVQKRNLPQYCPLCLTTEQNPRQTSHCRPPPPGCISLCIGALYFKSQDLHSSFAHVSLVLKPFLVCKNPTSHFHQRYKYMRVYTHSQHWLRTECPYTLSQNFVVSVSPNSFTVGVNCA